MKFTMNTENSIKESMNYLLEKIFPGYIIGNKYFDFPAGDMFWALTEAVRRIFRIDIKNDIPNEKEPKTILWAI